MNEPKRKQQVAKITSYSSKPAGWFLHLEYVNDKGKTGYAQLMFGPHADESQGIFPLWQSPVDQVVVRCPVLTEPPLCGDYDGDLLVPIPEMVIHTMFFGGKAPNPSGIRRA